MRLNWLIPLLILSPLHALAATITIKLPDGVHAQSATAIAAKVETPGQIDGSTVSFNVTGANFLTM